MDEGVEYEFILPDESCRYEVIDRSGRARPQMFAFQRLHGAVLAWPVARSETMPGYRVRLIRRLKQGQQSPVEQSSNA